MSNDLPTVVTSAGLQPIAPAVIRASLEAKVAATNPGYTANLPGSMIEDILSTEVASVSECDSARVETVNSLTPLGANAFTLNQLGQIYGVPLGSETNTSVDVVFTGPPGYVIPPGFVVSDGTYQYTIADGGIIGSGGASAPLFALATIPGSWVVSAGTVTQLSTSVPSTISLSVTNPLAGTPGEGAETEASYRSRVIQAGQAIAQGMTTTLKTFLGNISGVSKRLISVLQTSAGWEVIVGGGDPYEVAYAIFRALFDISTLVGSSLNVTGITNANPGVVMTNLNHGFSNGQVVGINGVVGMSGINGVPFTIAVVDEKTFSIGISTIGLGVWTSGGVVTPNLRNEAVSINDYPNTYVIPFVNPPQQTTVVNLTWNTTATNFVSSSAVAQLGVPAIAAYINSIPVGQPINVFVMETVFQEAIASVLPALLLTRMVWTVSINGIGTAPNAGTEIIVGDPESYFFIVESDVNITQG